MNNATIEISGFVPSKDLQTYLQRKINDLIDASPITSFIRLVLCAQDREIHGELTVNSPEKNFHSKLNDKSIATVVLHLSEDVQKQIHRWKKVRFYLDPTLKMAN